MHGSKRFLAALACCAAPLLLGAAQPPSPGFVPAMSYRYGSNSTELRLANADGSQAVLLARMPLASGLTNAIYRSALDAIGRRRAAFVWASAIGSQEVRLVSWTQPTLGGALSVTLDPTPILSLTGTGLEISSVDFSPDGSTLATVATYQGKNQELRFFDLATKVQIGATIPLAIFGANAHYRPLDGSLLLDNSSNGFSTWKDGVQTALFNPVTGGIFDNFNGAASDVIVQGAVNGVQTLQLWDGVTTNAPVLTPLVQGFWPSVSCDNLSMIYQRGSRKKSLIYSFTSHVETQFSQDDRISYLTYPNVCG